jgi:hypothetical protein
MYGTVLLSMIEQLSIDDLVHTFEDVTVIVHRRKCTSITEDLSFYIKAISFTSFIYRRASLVWDREEINHKEAAGSFNCSAVSAHPSHGRLLPPYSSASLRSIPVQPLNKASAKFRSFQVD